ncbi:TolC family protein [Microbacter margulisiae]|uniref:Cobalt-zinc-cadmium efflux system outer membrane protein n=1 Tax=Microbacter margulisiae TaxID=1350067 RepID=A0A7W5DPL1_9PORP|nr:TolC family protein [Microbacter margulisiae]MBB3186747.1 cobalt-zinc-cadmium efflux system outer membrane protein [Microbacter margulisiae]
MQSKIKTIVIVLLLSFAIKGQAQTISQPIMQADTIHLTLDSIETIFLHKNLLLLAQHYNISAHQALVLQAKMFPNPTININTPIYETDTKQFFPFGSTGELSGGISQIILLANKHNKQIRIAETNTALAKYQFYDLLRTLNHTLRVDFFNLHYLMESAQVYTTEINALQKLSQAFNEQKRRGYVSEKEAIRIQAQLYSLENEYNDLHNQFLDLQSELQVMLQLKNNVIILPTVNKRGIIRLNPFQYSASVLIDSAYASRPDLKIAKLNVVLSNQNYDLQKAMAVPDITLQFGYDQQGSYIHNLTTVGISMDLPFLDRNQGNIKSAKALIGYNQLSYDDMRLSVQAEIYNALQKAIGEYQLIEQRDKTFDQNFSQLLTGILQNYQKRNISLLDFLDFYDSYKENAIEYNALKFNLVNACEDLNFYTGNTFFNK